MDTDINTFGRISFVTWTAEDLRKESEAEKMTETELLAVLDMSEGEHKQAIVDLLDEETMEWFVDYDMHLADLAFRLRDEVVGVKIEGIVPNYFDKSVPRIHRSISLFHWFKAKRLIDEKLETHFYPGNCDSWWSEQSKPIHWIIAALIAKGKRR